MNKRKMIPACKKCSCNYNFCPPDYEEKISQTSPLLRNSFYSLKVRRSAPAVLLFPSTHRSFKFLLEMYILSTSKLHLSIPAASWVTPYSRGHPTCCQQLAHTIATVRPVVLCRSMPQSTILFGITEERQATKLFTSRWAGLCYVYRSVQESVWTGWSEWWQILSLLIY